MNSPAPVPGTQSGPVVVTVPAVIDITNARAVEGRLCAASASGMAVIADLSATTFCDSAGARALLRAHQQAAARHVKFLVAVPPGAARRILTLLAYDTILQFVPTVTEAIDTGIQTPDLAPSRYRCPPG